jgi:hypothetical protein
LFHSWLELSCYAGTTHLCWKKCWADLVSECSIYIYVYPGDLNVRLFMRLPYGYRYFMEILHGDRTGLEWDKLKQLHVRV